ncbi:MAG: GtrA family protein, partial [Bacteroidales bacterium]|nr:GtrA family protein [Bacteroidales bacterium]
MNPLILKFIKFSLVGFSGLFVDFGITWWLKERMKVQKYLANAAGFIIAASTNYTLNRIWTFESNNPHIATEYARFVIAVTIGLGINSLVLWLLVSKVKWNFYLSKLIAITIT